MKNLLGYLSKVYAKDKFVELYDKYKEVSKFRRQKNTSVEKFILDFEYLLGEAEEKGLSYPDSIKAFMLLEGSKTKELEKQLIVSGIKISEERTDLLEQMKLSIKKQAGEQRSLGRGGGGDKVTVEEAEAYLARNADVFAQMGLKKDRRRSYSDSEVSGGRGTKNPKGRDGKVMTCHFCNSDEHFKPSVRLTESLLGS